MEINSPSRLEALAGVPVRVGLRRADGVCIYPKHWQTVHGPKGVLLRTHLTNLATGWCLTGPVLNGKRMPLGQGGFPIWSQGPNYTMTFEIGLEHLIQVWCCTAGAKRNGD